MDARPSRRTLRLILWVVSSTETQGASTRARPASLARACSA